MSSNGAINITVQSGATVNIATPSAPNAAASPVAGSELIYSQDDFDKAINERMRAIEKEIGEHANSIASKVASEITNKLVSQHISKLTDDIHLLTGALITIYDGNALRNVPGGYAVPVVRAGRKADVAHCVGGVQEIEDTDPVIEIWDSIYYLYDQQAKQIDKRAAASEQA